MSYFLIRPGISTAASGTTESEHYKQHSEAIQTIMKDLDGYAGSVSSLTELQHYNQHSDAIQTIVKDLDGYGHLKQLDTWNYELNTGGVGDLANLRTNTIDAYGEINIHAGDNPEIARFISISHDGTDGYIHSDFGNIKLQPPDNGAVKIMGQIASNLSTTYTPTGTTETIDFNRGNFQILNLSSASGNVTLTLSNPLTNGSYVIKIIQDDSSPIDVVWPGTVKWPGGASAPIISTGANAVDIVSLVWDGSTYYAAIVQAY